MRVLYIVVLMLIMVSSSVFGQITSAQTGNWSNTATWVGGIVPGASDDVIIASSQTVTIDIVNAECKNITINGTLSFPDVNGNGITFYGDVSIASTGFLNTYVTGNPTGIRNSYITFYKNLTLSPSGRIDMRRGSGSNVGVGRVSFVGGSNSTISLNLTTYTSSSEEFNTVVINKTGGSKVILASGNLYQNNNSSTAADTLLFVSGIIETQGASRWVHLATSASAVMGASATCHVNGILGRGMSNSAGSTRKIDIGDGTVYRPITVQSISSGAATGHYIYAQTISGNANTGSSSLPGTLGKLATARYVKFGYSSSDGGAATMSFVRFSPYYNSDDGIVAGNTDLRIAYSTDNRSSWSDLGPTNHTTTLASPPTLLTSDSLTSALVVSSGSNVYVALATANGSTTNPLPVELSSFTGAIRGTTVDLRWTTATEHENLGFNLERSVNDTWQAVGFVQGAGNSNVPQQYSFSTPAGKGSQSFRLKQMDRNGAFRYSQTINVAAVGAPEALAIHGNYPNPFNPSTVISFSVPTEGRAVLTVYNTLGQECAQLFDGIAAPGALQHVTFDAAQFSAGVYLARLQFGSSLVTRKMLLVK